MSLYTIVFILVTVILLIGLSLFGLFISKLDKWIDSRERLGRDSIYKKEKSKSLNEKPVE